MVRLLSSSLIKLFPSLRSRYSVLVILYKVTIAWSAVCGWKKAGGLEKANQARGLRLPIAPDFPNTLRRGAAGGRHWEQFEAELTMEFALVLPHRMHATNGRNEAK